jgi:hypothetical protein
MPGSCSGNRHCHAEGKAGSKRTLCLSDRRATEEIVKGSAFTEGFVGRGNIFGNALGFRTISHISIIYDAPGLN